MKQKYLVVLMAILYIALIQSCKDASKKNEDTIQNESEVMFQAIEMPSMLANGDPFPTDSTTINGWLKEKSIFNGLETNSKVIGHAWGLWQALTEMTNQKYEGRTLRRYETWYTPQDVMRAASENTALSDLQRTDGNLQFRPKFSIGHDKNLDPSAGDISGKVKYSPGMAQRALDGNYFDSTYLKSKIVEGEINTLRFNAEDIMLKPIYRVLTDLNKIKGKNDTYYFNIWGGKEDGGKPDSLFSKKIYVCTNNASTDIDNSSTYGIDAFIHHKMSEAEAFTYNNSTKEGNEFVDTARAGDPVILLGMHVSTRETQRWTWQSFYWTESPDNPIFPSSSVIAAERNKLLTPLGSPENHYAASIGYSMMSPALPYEGPPVDILKSGVSPVYALNPYIEGTFGKDVFPRQDSFYTGGYAKQFFPGNVDGITSNCMSCHSQAAFNGEKFNAATFLADQYVNRNAPWFEGAVQLDFAWSLYPGFEPQPSQVNKPNN